MSITLESRHKFDWFSPKGFESEELYERIGILPFKEYLPYSGDRVMRRSARKQVHPNLESLISAEKRTRNLEKGHLWLFGLYSVMSAAALEADGWPVAFLILAANLGVNVYPVFLQRYNRIRLLPVIEKMKVRNASKPRLSTP